MSRFQKYKQRLEELKAQPKRSLGQNFLINEEAIQKVTDWVKNQGIENVFEIGPGLGALTEFIYPDFPKFKVVELDTKFAEYWRNQGVEVIEHDALKLDWIQQLQADRNILMSNLPYQISAPLVIELSQLDKSFESMILMFQKEVAQRITAEHSSSEYGLISVVAQTYWQINRFMDLSPRDFYPAPKVASRLLCFKSLCFKGVPADKFVKFVKHCFSQRRKVLLKRLKDYKSLEELEEIFESLNIDKKSRPENLRPQEYVQLFRKVIGA